MNEGLVSSESHQNLPCLPRVSSGMTECILFNIVYAMEIYLRICSGDYVSRQETTDSSPSTRPPRRRITARGQSPRARKVALYCSSMTLRSFSAARATPHARARLITVASFVVVVTSAVLSTSPVQAIGPQDRRLANARTGISIEAPAGWTLSQHTGYGDTIVLLLHPDGSRISVTAANTAARDAAALLQQNRPGLIAQGLSPAPPGSGPRGSLVIDLGASGRADRVRQLYLVRDVPGGRQAVVLTLVCHADAFASRVSALDFVATRLGLEDPAAPAGALRAAGTSSGSGGKTGQVGSRSQTRASDQKRDAGPQEIEKR